MAGKINVNDICGAFNTFQKLEYGKGRAAAGRVLVAVVNEYVRQNMRSKPYTPPVQAPPVQAPPVQNKRDDADDAQKYVDGIMDLLFGPRS